MVKSTQGKEAFITHVKHSALHCTDIEFYSRANTEILAGIQFRSAVIRLCSSCETRIFQSRRSTRSPLALSSVAAYMPISRDLRQQMLSDHLSNLMSLTLSVWPLAHNVDWTPETSRPCTGRPGLWASILSEHACVYVCVSGCVPVWVYCDSEAHHPALHHPPKFGRTALDDGG